VSLEVDADGEIGESARTGNTDDLTAQVFDALGFFAAEKCVVGVVRQRGDDLQIEATGVAADRRLGAADAGEVDVSRDQCGDRYRSAADKDRFERQSVVFEETFGDSDAKRQLVIPREADEDDAEIFLFLGVGGKRVKKYHR
jgi:hypothetical protein